MSSQPRSRKSTKTTEPEVVPEPVVVAPVVEAAPVEVAAADEVTETYEAVMTTFRERMSVLMSSVKEMNGMMKSLERLHAREVKAGGKSRRSQPKKDRAPSGFAKATPVPEALRKFLGLEAGVELPRTEVAKQIYAYVREKNLRDKEDRRIIHPDKALQKLFTLGDKETLDFKNFQKQLSRHYPKSAKAEVAEAETAAAPAPVVAAPPAAEGGAKRRSRAAGATA
jgi:chromatin remodeling complex protein RSC6